MKAMAEHRLEAFGTNDNGGDLEDFKELTLAPLEVNVMPQQIHPSQVERKF
jgi:hypothetical protein